MSYQQIFCIKLHKRSKLSNISLFINKSCLYFSRFKGQLQIERNNDDKTFFCDLHKFFSSVLHSFDYNFYISYLILILNIFKIHCQISFVIFLFTVESYIPCKRRIAVIWYKFSFCLVRMQCSTPEMSHTNFIRIGKYHRVQKTILLQKLNWLIKFFMNCIPDAFVEFHSSLSLFILFQAIIH